MRSYQAERSLPLTVRAFERAPSYPSPREAVGREGRSEAEARVGGFVTNSVYEIRPPPRFAFRFAPCEPTLPTASRGEGSKRIWRSRSGLATIEPYAIPPRLRGS